MGHFRCMEMYANDLGYFPCMLSVMVFGPFLYDVLIRRTERKENVWEFSGNLMSGTCYGSHSAICDVYVCKLCVGGCAYEPFRKQKIKNTMTLDIRPGEAYGNAPASRPACIYKYGISQLRVFSNEIKYLKMKKIRMFSVYAILTVQSSCPPSVWYDCVSSSSLLRRCSSFQTYGTNG